MVAVCSPQVGAQFCIFEAKDDTLMEFTDQGSLYTTNVTYGNVDGNIVWQPQNVSANMMECPDLFPLGDKWVLIGSLYKTNQWWVGDMVADAGGVPRFTPDQVGILDYGNGYAAKTGKCQRMNKQSANPHVCSPGTKVARYCCGLYLRSTCDLYLRSADVRSISVTPFIINPKGAPWSKAGRPGVLSLGLQVRPFMSFAQRWQITPGKRVQWNGPFYYIYILLFW